MQETQENEVLEVQDTSTLPLQSKTPGRVKRKPKKKRKWPKVLIIIAIVVLAFYWFILRPMGQSSMQAVASMYSPAQVSVRDLTVSVKGSATVQPIESYRVTALVRGEILEAPFEEGDIIEQDSLLYRIDAFDAENAISQAELNLRQATINYNNTLESVDTGLKNLNIESTADGVITKLHIEQGDTVAAGTPIATIVDRENMLLTVPFHSVDAASFYVGQSVTVSVSGTMETIAGVIDEISVIDATGAGGTIVRDVTIKVKNPGTLSSASTGSASVGDITCAALGNFSNAAEETIYATSTGEVKKLSVKEGDYVTDGQILGSMPASSLENQQELASISLENARIGLANAQHALENYYITSPISGTVVEKNLKAGDNLDTATGYLAVIYDMSTLTFEMNIDELDISKIALGQSVEITAQAVPGETFYGHVENININGVTASGVTVYPVTIHIDEAGALLPGMNVQAEIICEQAGNVLTIPVGAVKSGDTVLVVPESAISADGKELVDVSVLGNERSVVTLGRNDRDYVEVIDGLQEGDWVLIESTTNNMMLMMMGMG